MENKVSVSNNSLFGRIFKYLGRLLFLYIVILAVVSGSILYLLYGVQEDTFWKFFGTEIFKGIFVTSVVAGLLRWFFNNQFVEELKNLEDIKESHVSEKFNELKLDIEGQTNKITNYSISLNAMGDSGVTRFYSSRGEASEDIKEAIEIALEKEDDIKIIGISLNEFTRDENDIMHRTWGLIEDFLHERVQKGVQTNVQAMIIDPKSRGGWLRATAENEEDKKTRLDYDIQKAITDFLELEAGVKEIDSSNFEVKMYRTSPIFYMIWTPNVAFVQQYYFRPKHKADVKIPVLRYVPNTSLMKPSIHAELKFHFKWIWNNASVSIAEYQNESSQGVFEAIRKTNIQNIIYGSSNGKSRIIHLIKSSKSEVWIKGITLKTFFSDQGRGGFKNAIVNACLEGVKIRMMILDPDSEQALIRSYKEYTLEGGEMKYGEFKLDKEIIREQTLYSDIRKVIKELKKVYSSREVNKIKENLVVKTYFSAPEAFILMTESKMLIEQYHYGKLKEEVTMTILGGDVPLIEYHDIEDDNSSLFKTYQDHIKYVWSSFTKDIDLY